MLNKIKLIQAIKSGRFANITNLTNIYEVMSEAKKLILAKDIFNELSKKACKINAFEKMRILRDNYLIENIYLVDNLADGKTVFNWGNEVVTEYLLWSLRFKGIEQFITTWMDSIDHYALIEFINEHEIDILKDLLLVHDGQRGLIAVSGNYVSHLDRFIQLYIQVQSSK